MGFVRRLIAKIFGFSKEPNNDYQEKQNQHADNCTYSKLAFNDSISKTPFFEIETINNLNIRDKVDNNIKSIGKADRILSLVQYLPLAQNIAQSKISESAFRIVMPEGAVGQLIKYNNGMFGTPLVQPNGQIGNMHAGLVPLQNISLTPLFIFTILSAITGQYFMAKINKSLESISNNVKSIINMLLDDKEARNTAIIDFYSNIRSNSEFILENSNLKIATLTNLQSFLVDLKQNERFYKKTIERKYSENNDKIKELHTTSARVSILQESEKEVSNLLGQHHICINLYVIGRVYEMQLAQIFDQRYSTKVIAEFEQSCSEAIDFYQLIKDKNERILNYIETKAIINQRMIDEQRESFKINLQKPTDDFVINTKSVISSIEDAMRVNFEQQEFYIQRGELYHVQKYR